MKTILIIYHSQSGIVEEMSLAIKKGIRDISKDTKIELKKAQEAGWNDLKIASGIAIGTPDYFDYMSGAVKDFFDRTFYPSQSKIKGSLTADIPCILFASGGTGGEPAIESLKKVSMYFKFKIIDYIAVGSQITPENLKRCEELGESLAKAVLKKD